MGKPVGQSRKSKFNPLSTTGLLTPFLIGSYLEIFTCVANYDRALKCCMHKLAHETIFLTPLLISSEYESLYLLTNRQVVLMGLKEKMTLVHIFADYS